MKAPITAARDFWHEQNIAIEDAASYRDNYLQAVQELIRLGQIDPQRSHELVATHERRCHFLIKAGHCNCAVKIFLATPAQLARLVERDTSVLMDLVRLK